MNKKAKEISCLSRLEETTMQIDSIIEFLVSESLLDSYQTKQVLQSSDKAKHLQETLRELQFKQKIQLLEYSWQLLPVEHIRVYIVTDKNQAEFVYNI